MTKTLRSTLSASSTKPSAFRSAAGLKLVLLLASTLAKALGSLGVSVPVKSRSPSPEPLDVCV